jgi:hypothetical protein
LGLLTEFDEDKNGALSKTEFSSFLLATDIKEFNNKNIRKIVIQNIYKYFPKLIIPIN